MISLNPNYRIKYDMKRMILFFKKENNSCDVYDWVSFIHPIHAYIVGVFAFEHDITTAKSIICKKLNISKESINSFIYNLLENTNYSHINVGDIICNFPPRLLINENCKHPQINLAMVIEEGLKIKNVDTKNKRLFSGPLDITWMLNNKCFVNCSYCYADTSFKCSELNFKQFCEIVDECVQNNVRNFEIIGGDIFVKKDWDKNIEYLVKNKLQPSYLSTKKPLKTEEIKKLVSIGFNKTLQISLDSLFLSELESMIHCGSSYIKKIREMFESLKSEQNITFKIRISSVLCNNNCNIQNIEYLYNFIVGLNIIDEWEIRFAFQAFNQQSHFLCSLKQINEMTNYIHKIMHENKIRITFIENTFSGNSSNVKLWNERKYYYRCTANLRHCFILPDGKVTICEKLYWNSNFIIGDVNKNSLTEIWQSDRAIKLEKIEHQISQNSQCFNCEGKDECFIERKRCWVDVVNYWGKDNITYPDPKCYMSNKQIVYEERN